jgi:hypothetical protein
MPRAAAAAAGVLTTATGTVGGCVAAWAGGDRLWSAGRAQARPSPALAPADER